MQPIWYFNLIGRSEYPLFIDFNKINDQYRKLISYDTTYASQEGSLRDAAYQALQKGVVLFDHSVTLKRSIPSLLVEDEYHFIRKYYNSIWSVYILIIRLFTLHNPFIEIRAFFKSYGLKRTDIYACINEWSHYQVYESTLVKSEPLVSVVIPTLNRYSFLKDVMIDLERQNYKNFEVIVVDQSDPFERGFYDGWNLNMQVIYQPEKALWLARNTAIRLAKSDLILLYDDDARVDPDWIVQHLKCLDFFKIDISAGVSLSVVGAKIPTNYSFLRWADQFDTGNVLIRKEVFAQVGLFDRQFEKQRLGDGEFGLRAYLAGYLGISNPYAKRIHLKGGTGGLRQMGSWDGLRPTNFFAPRPIPSVNYLTRKYFGNKITFFTLVLSLPLSIVPYRYKNRPTLFLFPHSLYFLFLHYWFSR